MFLYIVWPSATKSGSVRGLANRNLSLNFENFDPRVPQYHAATSDALEFLSHHTVSVGIGGILSLLSVCGESPKSTKSGVQIGKLCFRGFPWGPQKVKG